MNNKVLICTTGKRVELTKFFDSLSNNASYTGDILLINYGNTSKDSTENVNDIPKLYKNVILVDTKQVYGIDTKAQDWFRASYEILVEQYVGSMYDIIMIIDGDDVWFNGNLEELFNLAKDRVCYVTHDKTLNRDWHPYADTGNIEYWKNIKDKSLASCGMFIGPRELIFQIFEHMYKYMKIMKKQYDVFGIDMYLFNCLIYHYKIPSKVVDAKWNTGATSLKNKYRKTDIIIHNTCTVAKGELIE